MQASTDSIATRPPATTGQGSASPGRTRSSARADQPARPADERALPQLSLGAIIGVWAAADLPMGLLAWVVAPRLADHLSGPAALSRALIFTLTVGLVWQFVLVATLVAREQGTLRWTVVKDALWLHAPRAPRTGRRGGRVWLVVVPLIVALGVEELVPGPASPAGRDMGDFLGSHAGHMLLAGRGAGSPFSPRCSSSIPFWARSCCSAGSCFPG